MMPDSTLSAHVGADLERRGYCIVENFLDADARAALARECGALHARNQLRPAAVGNVGERHVDARVRGDHTHWFDPLDLTAEQSAYWAPMDALRRALNRRLLLGMEQFETHYALYPPGTRYARHRDRFRDDDSRVLSSVLYLNPGWHDSDGGALRLHLDPAVPDSHLDIYPHDGTLVLFLSADFEHEVLPTGRERLSVAGWFRR
ncbi:MAG TPA: 2OG-Fe(II) oxygenase [Rudaea sp.]|jgi:SM-20-related protein